VRSWKVLLTDHAVHDLGDAYGFIARKDGPDAADRVLDRIEEAIAALASFPNRGTRPRELLDLGIREYREVVALNFRVIYRIVDRAVYVFVIADGRRDMKQLLERRILRM